MKEKIVKLWTLFMVGGTVYTLIEKIWRSLRGSHPTHWTMFIVGGICFLAIGAINEFFPWEMKLWKQILIGTGLVLLIEFVSGCILNLWLKLNIWDYSHVPFNLLGQVCLPFAFAWVFIVLFAIVLDDYLRFLLFNEEKPHYKL